MAKRTYRACVEAELLFDVIFDEEQPEILVKEQAARLLESLLDEECGIAIPSDGLEERHIRVYPVGVGSGADSAREAQSGDIAIVDQY